MAILQYIFSRFLEILNIIFFKLELHWVVAFIKTGVNNPEFGLPISLWEMDSSEATIDLTSDENYSE